MDNGQLRNMIDRAVAEVQSKGYDGASQGAVVLAGIAYLESRLMKNTVFLRLEGKRFFALGSLAGGAVGSAILQIWHAVGG